MKIKKRYYNRVFSNLAATLISVPIAFIMVVLNRGFIAGFFGAFVKSAVVSIVVSIPLAAIGIPIAEWLARRLVEE